MYEVYFLLNFVERYCACPCSAIRRLFTYTHTRTNRHIDTRVDTFHHLLPQVYLGFFFLSLSLFVGCGKLGKVGTQCYKMLQDEEREKGR